MIAMADSNHLSRGEDAAGHFRRFNQLADVIMWHLTFNELRVLMRLEQRAAADGTTWAGFEHVTDSGRLMDRRHYYRALAELTEKGILRTVGHRPNGVAIRQITLGEWQNTPLAESATGRKGHGQNPPLAENASGEIDPGGVAESASKPVAESATRSSHRSSQGSTQGAAAAKLKANWKPEDVIVPLDLQLPEFLETWAEFLASRPAVAKAKKKSLTLGTVKRWLKQCSEHGVEVSIERLRLSIDESYWKIVWPEMDDKGFSSRPAGRNGHASHHGLAAAGGGSIRETRVIG